MLDDLIVRYGEGALVVVSPYVSDEGETLRWVAQIDGHDDSSIDVRVTAASTDDVCVMTLVHNDEEIELDRWAEALLPHGPVQVTRSLRDLEARR